MQNLLQTYLRRLTNLSANNKSLLLLRLLNNQHIDLNEFAFENGEKSFSIISQLIQKKENISICKNLDSNSVITNELAKKVKKLSRSANFLFEERGVKDLYVGWPFVQGKFSNGQIVRCPLLFFPVELAQNNNQWVLKRRKEVSITFNKPFLLAYAFYNGLPLDENLMDIDLDDYEQNDIAFRTQLYSLLNSSSLEISFNPDNFTDIIQAFKEYKKDDFLTHEKNGKLRLYPEAVLGIFPQSGSYLVPDYLKIIKRSEYDRLEDFFADRVHISQNKNQLILFDQVDEANTFTPFLIDAFQEEALVKVKNGESLVVQGPPGTGKSQLIANLVGDFVARGKNVLVVCQKRAALDVVYDRLKSKEMHPFAALVHDFKNDRKRIYQQIAQQIDALDIFQSKNNGLDTVQLERNFLQASRRIDQIVEELDDFRNALFDDGECGKTAKELYLTSDPNQEAININLEYHHFHFNTLDSISKRFKNYLKYHSKYEKTGHFWNKGASFSNFQNSDYRKLLQLPEKILEQNKKWIDQSNSFCVAPLDFEVMHYFSTKLDEIRQLKKGLKDEITFKIYKQLWEDTPTKDLNWLSQTERTIMSCFVGKGMETTLPNEELGRFQEVLKAAFDANNSPLSWLKWRTFSKDKTFLKRVLVANKLKSNNNDFTELVEKIDNRLNYEHSLSLIHENAWLHNFPKTFKKIDIQDWFFWQKEGLRMYELAHSIRQLNDYLPISKLSQKKYLNDLADLADLCKEIPKQLEEWKKFINLNQVRSIILKKVELESIKKTLKRDFDELKDFHILKENLKEEEVKVLQKLIELGEKSLEQKMDIFHNSLGLAWVDHLESKYPILRIGSSHKIDELSAELREAIEIKRACSKEIFLMKAQEKTYENIEYNRLKNRVTYRDLHHQVTKKRMIWPMRKLISTHSEELFKLIPCWMCSPESVSALFPMKKIFDLVIFDEASQCFAERGLPAIYRGRQVVVTGDKNQLQPSDIYRVRWEDSNDSVDAEKDSLLELTERYFSQIQLNGHYRSKSLELIDFSNQHFYDGKLKLLPDYTHFSSGVSSILFEHTPDGIWENGVNTIEAEKVCQITINLLRNSPQKEIGIITFNYTQQQLIWDLLEHKLEEKNIDFPENLFIKNIENVQGDEKDIIIFSIGYAPDSEGKMKMQFGSLNATNGENRLNVAITRAREQIIVVSSIKPHQLKIAETKNEGPKLLKAYLRYVIDVAEGNWKPHLPQKLHQNNNWYLKSKINSEIFEERKLEIKNDLPFADLNVNEQNLPKGLILTDDEIYYNAISSKQIYAYNYFHLSSKNWEYIRLHSREYWIDKDKLTEKLERFSYKLTTN